MKRVLVQRSLVTGLAMSAMMGVNSASAGTVLQYPIQGIDPTPTIWPTTWTGIPLLNDTRNAGLDAEVDFVGDAAHPAVSMASTTKYLMFQLRVAYSGDLVPDVGNAQGTFHGTVSVLVDKDRNGTPDYGFAWDNKGKWLPDSTAAEHGLEMQVTGTNGATWKSTNLNDLDGLVGKKVSPPDFNTIGDGYVRTIDHSNQIDGADTTLIQYAISWNYLQTNSTLRPGQNWGIQVASIHDSTDLVFSPAISAAVSAPTVLWHPVGSRSLNQLLCRPSWFRCSVSAAAGSECRASVINKAAAKPPSEETNGNINSSTAVPFPVPPR